VPRELCPSAGVMGMQTPPAALQPGWSVPSITRRPFARRAFFSEVGIEAVFFSALMRYSVSSCACLLSFLPTGLSFSSRRPFLGSPIDQQVGSPPFEAGSGPETPARPPVLRVTTTLISLLSSRKRFPVRPPCAKFPSHCGGKGRISARCAGLAVYL